MRPTAAAMLFAVAGAVGAVFDESAVLASQAAAEQDFRPIWCPQATTGYIQVREALDPLRAATVAHDLDIAKARRHAAPPALPGPAPKVNSNPEQPPFTEDGNPLRPRYSEPAREAAQPQPAPGAAPAAPAPAKQWGWADPEVQEAVAQFEEKSPLLFRRINTIAAMTWWAELQDAGSALAAAFADVVGDEQEQAPPQVLVQDWAALEEQYDVVKNLCVGWGETAVPGEHPPGQEEWPEGATPDTARPPGIENTAWPHTPGWVDLPVPDPQDPEAPPAPRRPYPPEAAPTPLAPPGCERYDYRAGGWGQHAFCPDDGPGDADEEEASAE